MPLNSNFAIPFDYLRGRKTWPPTILQLLMIHFPTHSYALTATHHHSLAHNLHLLQLSHNKLTLRPLHVSYPAILHFTSRRLSLTNLNYFFSAGCSTPSSCWSPAFWITRLQKDPYRIQACSLTTTHTSSSTSSTAAWPTWVATPCAQCELDVYSNLYQALRAYQDNTAWIPQLTFHHTLRISSPPLPRPLRNLQHALTDTLAFLLLPSTQHLPQPENVHVQETDTAICSRMLMLRSRPRWIGVNLILLETAT